MYKCTTFQSERLTSNIYEFFFLSTNSYMHKCTCIGVDETFHSATQHSRPPVLLQCMAASNQQVGFFFTSKQIVKSFLCGNPSKDEFLWSFFRANLFELQHFKNRLDGLDSGRRLKGESFHTTWWIWYDMYSVYAKFKKNQSIHLVCYGSCICMGMDMNICDLFSFFVCQFSIKIFTRVSFY